LKVGANQTADRSATSEPEQTAQALIEQCLEAGAQLRATDIHVEPQPDRLTLRMRIEGQLKAWKEVPLDLHPQMIARLKQLARLEIGERRKTQEGRFTVPSKLGVREYRLTIVPMLDGEKAVLKLLHQDLSELTLKSIGYSEPSLKLYQELLNKPHGLLLHCGPTDSGRTSALYAALNQLKGPRNIQTVEDPIEGRVPGVNQAQVNVELGQTYSAILRSYLRQDCDVILIGEIRDAETAQLAIEAAHTGHLVLGALVASHALAAVQRLHELGVPPFYVSAALIGVVGQRLVRRICKACRRAYQPSLEIQQECNLSPHHQLYQAVGCPQCAKLGYRGRLGLQEVFAVTSSIRDAMQSGASSAELYALAAHHGMINLFTDGVFKCVAGYTTIEEVYKNVVAES